MFVSRHLQRRNLVQFSSSFITLFLLAVFVILAGSQPANALPAFARKYGLRCSACHESWPMLNYFGQKFKDNGYQMGNDRDAPIFQSPAYWPVTFRITPQCHRESTNKAAVDQTATGEAQVTTHGLHGRFCVLRLVVWFAALDCTTSFRLRQAAAFRKSKSHSL